jgi:hypothetical protein
MDCEARASLSESPEKSSQSQSPLRFQAFFPVDRSKRLDSPRRSFSGQLLRG